MAFAAHVFTQFMNSGDLAATLASHPFRVVLSGGTYATVSAGLTAVQDTAATMTAVKAAAGWTEMTSAQGGSNYVANANSHLSGLSLGTTTYSNTAHVFTWSTATALTWTTAGSAFNPCIAVFFDDNGATDATNIPILWWDFGANMAGTGGNYTLTVAGTGLLTATGT